MSAGQSNTPHRKAHIVSAPKPFSIPAPVKSTEPPKQRQTAPKDRGPNLFLDNDWLAQSYNDDEWYDVGPVDGQWEEGTVQKGKRKGEAVQRMTGVAQEVTRQLREAAMALGIGVAIKYTPVTYKSGAKVGQEIPGKILVQYLGIERKQSRKNADTEETDTEK
jgi:hypothetical protein